MLREVGARLPGLLPFVSACYSVPTTVFCNGFRFESSRGVQQGDVLGPLLFALAAQKVALHLEEMGLEFQYWYLDDVHLAGDVSTLGEAFLAAKCRLEALGLRLNTATWL